eukprot:Rhum_TRINITY_DN9539_c0_g1::Rhum_TRINITY_DN9539_c0_g1_i1::g.33779::m.33779
MRTSALCLLTAALCVSTAEGGDVVEAREEDGKWPVPLLTFGLIADPHANVKHRQPWWCDLPCWKKELKLAASSKGRKHAGVLKKIEESVEVLSRVPGISFSVNMGDLCDMDLLVNMPPVLDIWNRLPHPRHNLMGNHDLRGENDRFGEDAKKRNKTQAAWLLKQWGLSERFYYAFTYPPYRFLVLDSMSLPPTAQGAVVDEQVRWLSRQLQESSDAGEDVVIFAHIPIGLKSNAIREHLTRHSHILAVFFGHKHSGGYGYHQESGKHMITLQGMIETNINAFAYANIFVDRLEIVGFGRVPSRVYFFSDFQRRRAGARSVAAYSALLRPYEARPDFYSASRLASLRAQADAHAAAASAFAAPYAHHYAAPAADLSQRGFKTLPRQSDAAFLKSLDLAAAVPSGASSGAPRVEAQTRATATAAPATVAVRVHDAAVQEERPRQQQLQGERAVADVGGVDAASPAIQTTYVLVMSSSSALALALLWVKLKGLKRTR